MPANIEIKAVLTDSVSAHAIATRLSGAPAEVVDQTDIFFPCAGGRFKLRVRGPNDGELIFYDRPDGPEPRHSDYLIARTAEPWTLLEILTRTVGTSGVVRKRRSLYLVGQTRIHIDHVDGLGEYLELEVVLAPGQSDAEGQNIAMELLGHFSIDRSQCVAVAYVDLLRAKISVLP